MLSRDKIQEPQNNENGRAKEVEGLMGEDPRLCPAMGAGTLVLLESVPSRDELVYARHRRHRDRQSRRPHIAAELGPSPGPGRGETTRP